MLTIDNSSQTISTISNFNILMGGIETINALQVRLKALVTSCSSKWSCGLRIFGAGFQLLLRSPGLPPVHFIVPLLASPGPFLDFSWVLS